MKLTDRAARDVGHCRRAGPDGPDVSGADSVVRRPASQPVALNLYLTLSSSMSTPE